MRYTRTTTTSTVNVGERTCVSLLCVHNAVVIKNTVSLYVRRESERMIRSVNNNTAAGWMLIIENYN